jgi:hypothetical protein
VRHRRDAGRVDGCQLVDQAEDRLELCAHLFRVRRIDVEASESRDPVDIRKRESHGVGRGKPRKCPAGSGAGRSATGETDCWKRINGTRETPDFHTKSVREQCTIGYHNVIFLSRS